MTSTDVATSRVLTINGLRLHHLDWGNDGAPAIVCVHGFRGSAHGFDGFARRFRDRYHVVSLDVRGRGDSEWAKDGDYSMNAYVSDLEDTVDALRLQSFTLAGTSMGGRIAMHYAGRHPQRLERLVINDIGPESEAGSDRITREAGAVPDSFASLEAAIEYRRRTFPAAARLSDAEQREAALTLLRQSGDVWRWKNDPAFLAQRVAAGAESYPQLWEVLARLTSPTLLLWGTASDVLSETQAQRVIAALANGTLAKIPGAGHAPTLQEPEAVEALERFLT